MLLPWFIPARAASDLPATVKAEAALRPWTFRKIIMGSEARITLFHADERVATEAARAAFQRMEHLEDVMSSWRADSELRRLQRRPVGVAHPVSPPLLDVLQRSRVFSDHSGGAFDITVGPLVELWRSADHLPHPEAVAAARQRVDYRFVSIDASAGTVTLKRADLVLDLGAIGKGYAAEAAREVLADHGCPRCLIDLGGDLVCGDPPPGRAGWRIELDSLGGPGTTRMIEVARAAVATSGDRYRANVINGVRFSHIIDPRTGWPLTDRRTVTVVAPDGATADALASAVSVLGEGDDASALLARHDAAACIRHETAPGATLIGPFPAWRSGDASD